MIITLLNNNNTYYDNIMINYGFPDLKYIYICLKCIFMFSEQMVT